MGCNCGKRNRADSMTSLAPGDGGYLGLHHDDDGIGYSGPFAEEQVFIVAKGTPEERLFRKDDLAGASAYAREVGKPLVGPPAGSLPKLAMEKLFGEVTEPVG